jgi:hypothetical protein
MANTYSLIASNTLTVASSSVTFSSIPATFTDLVLKASIGPESYYNPSFDQFVRLWIIPNGSAGVISGTFMRGNGSTAISARETETGAWQAGIFTETNSNGANNFSSIEAYIPNYAGSTNKVISVNSAQENNTSSGDTSRIGAYAGLRSATSAITQISFLSTYGDWPIGSSFYLYGIKNS